MLFCTGSKVGKVMSFEEWYENNEDEVSIYLAESGADREMCFDSEKEFDDLYEIYLDWANGKRVTEPKMCRD